jgi:lactate 2-monooxygenase
MSRHGLDLQLGVYGAKEPARFPFSFEEWEDRARQVISEGAFGYVAGGAGAEETMRANREAFYRWRIRPRMLRGVSDRDLETTVLGTRSAAPFLLAPIGVQEIIHPEAELAVARAAAATGIPFILSTVSSMTIEQVAEEMEDAPRWFQLYPGKSNEIMSSMLHRAEESGYEAIVVTLDTTMLGFRERDLKNAYLPFLQGKGIANYLSDPAFREGFARDLEKDPQAAVKIFLDIYVNPMLSWDDIAFIREQTSLPILLKGMTHPEDVRAAMEHDIQGIIVSNHGGRQVDGAVAALDVLPEICEVVDGKVPVLLDSGIRRGADVLKALALGASAVLVGRPYAYGLAVGGEAGVAQVIRNLAADVDLELALSGYRSTKEVDRSLLAQACPTA